MCAFSPGAPPRVMLCRTPLAAKRVPKRRPQKLAAAVAVKDQAGGRVGAAEARRPAPRGSARESRVAAEPPRQNPARALIQDDRQGTTSGRRRRDTSGRRPRSDSGASPASVARDSDADRTTDGTRPSRDTRAPRAPASPSCAHQPFDPSTTHAMAPRRQRAMNRADCHRSRHCASKIARISSSRTRSCLARALAGRCRHA